jgi:hypothetical protein
MRIKYKHTESKWIELPEITEGLKVQCRYHDVDTMEELEELRYKCKDELKLISVKLTKNDSSIPEELESPLVLRYFRNYIKGCLIDWQGVKDIDTGEEIKFNKNDKNLLYQLLKEPVNLFLMYLKINRELEFNELDKKKLN